MYMTIIHVHVPACDNLTMLMPHCEHTIFKQGRTCMGMMPKSGDYRIFLLWWHKGAPLMMSTALMYIRASVHPSVLIHPPDCTCTKVTWTSWTCTCVSTRTRSRPCFMCYMYSALCHEWLLKPLLLSAMGKLVSQSSSYDKVFRVKHDMKQCDYNSCTIQLECQLAISVALQPS